MLKLSDSNITGNVTFVAAGKIDISASNFTLNAFLHNILLLFSTIADPDAINVAGSGGSWSGVIYAPNGRANVSGSGNLSIAGGIVANEVTLNGSSWSVTAAAGSAGSTQLIE